MKKILIMLITFIIIITSVLLLALDYSRKYKPIKLNELIVHYDNILNSDDTYNVTFTYLDDPDVYCSIDAENYIPIKDCTFRLKAGTYKLFLKRNMLDTFKEFTIHPKFVGTFSSPIDVLSEYYLALGGTKDLDFTFDYPEEYKTNRKYIIEDESIISIKKDIVKGLKVGTTRFTVQLPDGNNKTYTVTVTDLIQPITLNNNKPYLPCKKYTEEQAHLLDKILESRIKEAGEGTRGATVAIARFLTMEFPYQIRYFNENGRLDGHGRPVIDGEGRYYHKGLYLSEDKYKDIVKSTPSGPKIWGCNIYDQFIAKMNMNGFTCSGFVTWVLYNAGLNPGDVGAGDYPQFNDDLSDMGPHHEITEEYMKTGNYKVGDFIGRNGHAALIIGIDDDTIYTAESLPPKLKVYTYERYQGIVQDKNLTYVIEMDDNYPNGEGYYKNMW